MINNIFTLMIKISNMTCEINRLLGITFIEKNKSLKFPIGKRLKNIILFYNQGKYKESEFEILATEFLINHLKILEQNNIILFNYYRKILLYDIKNNDKYFGSRFEISIAATLQEKSLIFEKTEPPLADFYIDKYKVYIECASRHTDNDKIKEKWVSVLKDTINKKSKKKYANKNTALFIDITNIYNGSMNYDNTLIDRDLLINELSDCIKSSKFGSFLFFVYMHDVDNNFFRQNYIRIDNENITSDLLKFLDDNFVLGNLRIYNFGVSNMS